MVTTASSALRSKGPLHSARVIRECRVRSALYFRNVGVRAQRVADDQARWRAHHAHPARFPSIDDGPELVDAHGVETDSDAPGRDCLKGADARVLHQRRRHSAALVERHSARHAVFRRTSPQAAEFAGGLVVRGDLGAVRRCHPDDRRIARERAGIRRRVLVDHDHSSRMTRRQEPPHRRRRAVPGSRGKASRRPAVPEGPIRRQLPRSAERGDSHENRDSERRGTKRHRCQQYEWSLRGAPTTSSPHGRLRGIAHARCAGWPSARFNSTFRSSCLSAADARHIDMLERPWLGTASGTAHPPQCCCKKIQ